jgi:CO/xanthine dehydrogenase Mo-binding subunit
VYTNLPRNGAYRGYAVTQMVFASEAVMDMAAERIGMDPLEFRLKNLLHEGDIFATGQEMNDVKFEECLRDAARAIGWDTGQRQVTRDGKLRGKGLSVLLKGMLTPGVSNATVELTAGGQAKSIRDLGWARDLAPSSPRSPRSAELPYSAFRS